MCATFQEVFLKRVPCRLPVGWKGGCDSWTICGQLGPCGDLENGSHTWGSNKTEGAWAPEDLEEQGRHISPFYHGCHLGENGNPILLPHYPVGLPITQARPKCN